MIRQEIKKRGDDHSPQKINTFFPEELIEITKKLAYFVAALKYEDIPQQVQHKAKHCFLDWLGSVYASYEKEISKKYILLALAQGQKGPCTIIGTKEKTSLLWSAFANSALGHIAETDDGHKTSILHPGTVTIPAALATCEKKELSGKDFLTAVVAGYEVAMRVGECLGEKHYTLWHTTGTAGTFGSASAMAKLLRIDSQGIISILGHAGTQAAGLWQFLLDGQAQAKPLHPAKATLNGILAAEFHNHGIHGARRILEGEKGLCKAMAPNGDLSKLEESLGEYFKINETTFKAYPTCGQTHSAICSVEKIMREHCFKNKDIQEIIVYTYEKALDIAGIKEPKNLEEAKFSLPFCIAFLLKTGKITFKNMEEKHLRETEIQDLMKKVHLHMDPTLDQKFPQERPSKVVVHLKDGKELFATSNFRKGDPENPLTEEEIIHKFMELSHHKLKPNKQKEIIEWALHIEAENTLSINTILNEEVK